MWKARIVQKILGKASDDSLLLKDFFGPPKLALSKTGRFLSKAEILGGPGVFSLLSIFIR